MRYFNNDARRNSWGKLRKEKAEGVSSNNLEVIF